MIREASTATPTPASAAQAQCQPQPIQCGPAVDNAQVTMPASMNSAGMVKFKKLSMPMVRVKATATKARTPPSIKPLMICCKSCKVFDSNECIASCQKFRRTMPGKALNMPLLCDRFWCWRSPCWCARAAHTPCLEYTDV